jgi:hypothetical protein
VIDETIDQVQYPRMSGSVDAWISDGFSKRISRVSDSNIGVGLKESG